MNFPERRRQRQIGALARLPGDANAERRVLIAAIDKGNQRGVRTKKPLIGGSVGRQERHGGKLVRAR